jgi:long-chain fatty acid transport protein
MKTVSRWIGKVGVLAAAMAGSVGQAQASAYYFVDSGTRAIGRGGAFVAGADNQEAQYYNPAALSNVGRSMANLEVWGIGQYVRFDRADEAGTTFEAVENQSPPIIEPQGGVVIPMGGVAPFLKDTTLALGMWVPSSPYLAYPAEGAQRYALIDSLIWQLYAGPSLAQRLPFARWITLGGSLEYTFLRVEESLAATLCYEGTECGSDDPEDDIVLDLKTWDRFKLSGNFGVLVEPAPWIKVGASAQPPIQYDAPGTMTATLSEDNELATSTFTDTTYTDEDIRVLVGVPWIVRAGVEVKPIDRLRVELAGNWINWSSLDKMVITDLDLAMETKEQDLETGENLLGFDDATVTDDVNFATGFQDSWSLRLGGQVEATDWLGLRAGGHYETSAIPAATQGVQLVDGEKWGVSLGATATVGKRVAIDVSAAEVFLSDKTIEGSELRQQALVVDLGNSPELTSRVDEGKVIGNGKFTSRLAFVAVGVVVYLDKAKP